MKLLHVEKFSRGVEQGEQRKQQEHYGRTEHDGKARIEKEDEEEEEEDEEEERRRRRRGRGRGKGREKQQDIFRTPAWKQDSGKARRTHRKTGN